MGMLHDQALHRLENPGPICCSTILNFKMQTESNCGKREPEKKNIARNEKQQKYNRKTLMKNTGKYIKKCFFSCFPSPFVVPSFILVCFPSVPGVYMLVFFCACSFSLFLCPVCFTSPFQAFSGQASHDKIICNLNYF